VGLGSDTFRVPENKIKSGRGGGRGGKKEKKEEVMTAVGHHWGALTFCRERKIKTLGRKGQGRKIDSHGKRKFGRSWGRYAHRKEGKMIQEKEGVWGDPKRGSV